MGYNVYKNLYQFYENLFSNDVPTSNKTVSNYLKDINLPKLSMEQREHYELSKKEVKVSLNKMENKKIPGNDGVTKLFLKML